MRTLAENALLYHDLGFSTIPLKPNTKRPAISSWKEYQHHRPNRRQVKDWFSDDDLGIGIITGQVSDLLVIDIDNPKGHGWLVRQGGIDTTPWVKTVRGWHVYMRYPKGVNFTKITPIDGLEISGNSHYVVAPPSKHPSGQRYEWIFHPNEVGLAEPRPWVQKAIKRGISGGFEAKSWKGARFSDMAIPPPPKKQTFNPVSFEACDKSALKQEIFNHYIWEGKPKKGSNNGLFLTRLIAHYRTGTNQEEAVQDVHKWVEGQVPYSKIKAASKVAWRREYGLKPQVIEQVSELDYEESYQFVNLVAQYDGWDTNQTKQKQLHPEEVIQRIVAATLFLNYRYSSLNRLAELSGVPYRTIYSRIREGRLPWYIQIKTIPNKGILIINLLPVLLTLLFAKFEVPERWGATVMSPLRGIYSNDNISLYQVGGGLVPDT